MDARSAVGAGNWSKETAAKSSWSLSSFVVIQILMAQVGVGVIDYRVLGQATDRYISSILDGVVSILLTPISAIAVTLLYYDFRIRKEGFDLEMLSQSIGGACNRGMIAAVPPEQVREITQTILKRREFQEDATRGLDRAIFCKGLSNGSPKCPNGRRQHPDAARMLIIVLGIVLLALLAHIGYTVISEFLCACASEMSAGTFVTTTCLPWKASPTTGTMHLPSQERRCNPEISIVRCGSRIEFSSPCSTFGKSCDSRDGKPIVITSANASPPMRQRPRFAK